MLLYELLCGVRPHGEADDTGPQLERAVLETEPRPLALSATRGSGGDRVSPEERAGRRGLTVRTLRKALRGDLDNILRKALRREPLQRYASVSALADDLRRHLAHEPVSARPDAFSYRAGKFLRRYRSGMAVAVAALIALGAGLGVALWQAQIARAQAQRAELQQRFLLSLFQEQDPLSRARAQARSPAELIAAGVEMARRETGNDPTLAAALLDSLGAVQITVDQPEAALTTLEEALRLQRARLPADDTAIASTLDHIGTAQLAAGRLRDAQGPLEEALAIYRAQLAPDDLRIAASEARLGRAILTTQTEDALALIQHAHARHAAQLGSDHPDTLARQLELGTAYGQADRLDLAEATYRDLIERQQRRLGPDHLVLAFPLTSLADLQRRLNRFADAQASYEQALRIGEAQLGAQHPTVAKIRMREANLLRLLGRLDEAETALAQAEAGLSEGDGGNLAQLHQLQGHVLLAQGRHAEAETRHRRSFERFRAVLGDNDPYTWNAALAVGQAQMARGALKDTEATLHEAVLRLDALSPPDGYDAAVSSGLLATAHRLQGAYREALPLDHRALAAFSKTYGEWHTSTLEVQAGLAADLLGLGDAASLVEARGLLDAALARPEVHEDAVLQGTLLIISAAAAQQQHDDARARLERLQGRTLLDGAGARGARAEVELQPFLGEPTATVALGS